jgi:hypothetical protein
MLATLLDLLPIHAKEMDGFYAPFYKKDKANYILFTE